MILAGLNAPPAPFVPEEHHFAPGYATLVAGFGSAEEHESVWRPGVPPLFEYVTPMPYVALQQMLDEANAWGFHYDKGAYLEELSDEAIDVIVEHLAAEEVAGFGVLMYRLDEAFSDVADDETAFSGAPPRFSAFIIAVCPGGRAAARRAAAGSARLLGRAARRTPWARVPTSTRSADVGQERVRASYGHKLDRLARVKATYDPDNVFHRTANIRPAVHA